MKNNQQTKVNVAEAVRLHEYHGYNLRQLGDHFGVSHERVRQVLVADGYWATRVKRPRDGWKYEDLVNKEKLEEALIQYRTKTNLARKLGTSPHTVDAWVKFHKVDYVPRTSGVYSKVFKW